MNGLPSAPPARWSDAELEQRRQRIRRGFRRANLAAAVTLFMVIAFSVAAILEGLRAGRKAVEASDATRRAEEQLWAAQLARARAARLSGVAGRKKESLDALAAAVQLRPVPVLRDELIAALALTDVSEDPAAVGRPLLPTDVPAFAPSLTRFALGRTNGDVEVFATGRAAPLTSLSGPQSRAVAVQFSPDERLLAARFQNGQIMGWNLTNGVLLFTHATESYGGGMSLDFSPDGRLLAFIGSTNRIRFYDCAAGAELAPLEFAMEREPARLQFRPDGQVLAVNVSSNLHLWRVRDRHLEQTLLLPDEVYTFTWHPDGRRLAVSFQSGNDVLLCDAATTNSLRLRGHSELVHRLQFNARADLLTSASWDGTTRFWNATSGELVFLTRAGFGLAFSRDGSRLAYTRENEALGWWTVSASSIYRELQLPLGLGRYISGFEFSPDGRRVALANPDGVWVCDVASGNPIAFRPEADCRSASFRSDGAGLVSVATSAVKAWALAPTNQEFELRQLAGPTLPRQITFDGGLVTPGPVRWLTLPSIDRVICLNLGDPTSWWELRGEGQMGPLTCAALSPDTNWIATTYWQDRGTSVWDTRTRQRVRELDRRGGFVSFSPDGTRLLVGSARHYAVWEVGAWRQVWELPRHSPGQLVGRGAFSPDGQWIALCPEVNAVQVVVADSGQKLALLTAPAQKTIGRLAFSPDGVRLAATTFEGGVQLWDLREIRRELAARGLDWENAPAAGKVVATHAAIPLAKASTGNGAAESRRPWFFLLAGLGTLVAVLVGIYVLRYQQRMMRDYQEIESLAAERNRELQQAQGGLLQSQKMRALGTLAAGIAHDFNNLLSVIRMGNKLLGRADTPAADRAESLAAVERAVQQGKRVVHSMLGYSREDPDQRAPFFVPEVVDEVVRLLSQEFLSGLTLTLELARDTPAVFCSRGRLQQILLNLIVNAAEAMAGQGRLRLTVIARNSPQGPFVLRPRSAAGYVELQVSDSGPGIAPAIRDRIFEPFFSTKPAGAASGTGLGLSLVHNFAEQEGMGIAVESVPAEGTTFRILVPVESAPAVDPADCAADAHWQTGAAPAK